MSSGHAAERHVRPHQPPPASGRPGYEYMMEKGFPMRHQLAIFSMAVVMTMLSVRQIYVLETAIIPNVLAIAPVSADKVSQAIARQIRDPEAGRAAAGLVRAQADIDNGEHSACCLGGRSCTRDLAALEALSRQEECGLTLRSTGHAPACRQAREAPRLSLRFAGQSPRRCVPVSSNVRFAVHARMAVNACSRAAGELCGWR